MTLFSSDLYRNFGIGFLIGGVAVALTNPTIVQSVIAFVA